MKKTLSYLTRKQTSESCYWTCRGYIPSLMTHRRVCNKSNTTAVTSEGRNCKPFRSAWVHPGFSGIRATLSLVFCVVYCRSLFVILAFFLLAIATFVHIRFRLLINPVVSLNLSNWRKVSNLESHQKHRWWPFNVTPSYKNQGRIFIQIPSDYI